jgi:hypothetical protein
MVNTGHIVMYENPEVVIVAIREVISDSSFEA